MTFSALGAEKCFWWEPF